ncbi:hypothetical protein CYMTET_46766 [Cymbomonas tetramitiformis]|uniref:Sulfotransferase n=1 Tax=Cymbomonas tetramitiformis TaxID=36881 RepID=A0AAE0BVM1_9CHLO|nr:hypothetical protein CYMTET_46766 [Cymbomonas tetramitiformis]
MHKSTQRRFIVLVLYSAVRSSALPPWHPRSFKSRHVLIPENDTAKGGHGRNDAYYAGKTALAAKTPPCVLGLFRHTSKTGGHTLRNVFMRQELMGKWQYHAIMNVNLIEATWTNLTRAFTSSVAYESNLRVIVEAHTMRVEAQVEAMFAGLTLMKDFSARQPAHMQCRIAAFTLVRNPVHFYLSSYTFHVLKMNHSLHFPTYERWIAAFPNLQMLNIRGNISMFADPSIGACTGMLCTNRSEVALHSTMDDPTEGACKPGIFQKEACCPCPPIEEDGAAMRHLNQYDIVGLTESFILSLLLIADALGLDDTQLFYKDAFSQKTHDTNGVYKKLLDDPALKRMVELKAPQDFEMYAWAEASFLYLSHLW